MTQFIDFFFQMWSIFIKFLNSYNFVIGNVTVSIFDVFTGLIVTGFIISVFWRGARN